MKQLFNNKRISERFYGISLVAVLLIVWQVVSDIELVPSFMLPSPVTVVKAFVKDFPVLMDNLSITLIAGLLGLTFGVIAGFCLAVLMDYRTGLCKAIYPILIFSQTVPTVAIAPLLVLWMGYGLAPKITVIFLVTFFPVTVNLLESFQAADPDQISLLQAMGATKFQIFYYVKWPGALDSFFAALKVSASYSIVGAVIAEWLGGSKGLGVYMTQVRKSFAYDKMFAVIFLISALSLVLLFGLNIIQNKVMPWKKFQLEEDTNNEKKS
ncbi:MAG TPA: ABC transporter permease [Clostridiaceae bacterium]|nr:ABC transporter permease [Clostridiaceae bacterium]